MVRFVNFKRNKLVVLEALKTGKLRNDRKQKEIILRIPSIRACTTIKQLKRKSSEESLFPNKNLQFSVPPVLHQFTNLNQFDITYKMCFQVVCEDCKKITYGGCGRHVESALRGVPEDKKCKCPPKGTKRG